MIKDLLGEEVLEDFAEWKNLFIDEKGVITHQSDDCDPSWTAFIGGWDRLAEYCSVMESMNELRHGKTEREALEKLAVCLKYPKFKV